MKCCDECSQWAQWKIEHPETKAQLFFCNVHKIEFLEAHPTYVDPMTKKEMPTKRWFCGVVIENAHT